MNTIVRLVLVLATALASTLAAASPAGAATSPYTRSDPTGDTFSLQTFTLVNRPKADIVSIRVDHKTDKVILRLTTRQGVDPATSPLWAPSTSSIRWGIDSMGDFTPEFAVTLGDRLAPSVSAALSGDPIPCAGAASRFVAPATYRVDVPKSCLGNPNRLRVKVEIRLGGLITGTSDGAPTPTATNFGYTPFVRPA